MCLNVCIVWPVKLYGVPKYTVDWVAGEDALTTDNNNNDNNGQGETVAARQAAAAADMFSPHVMTQVNQLRDDGTVGEGIKVAVIDTGVRPIPIPLLLCCSYFITHLGKLCTKVWS